jgi:hypothetical protein
MALLQSNTIIYGTANVYSVLTVGAVTSNNSVNTTTGSLIVTGGVGVSGNVYAGNVYSNGALVLTSEPYGNAAFGVANSAASFANSAYSLANSHNIIANTLITSTTTANQVAMLYSATTYRTSKVIAQITSGTSYQASQLSIIHDGANTYMTQYGDIYTSGSALGSFDSNISGGYLQLLFTPVNSVTTVKLSTTLIPI